jgi:hypothetical protein
LLTGIKNWRFSVKMSLIIAILEGALRKWIFPQASEALYLLKDIILLGSYLGFFYSKHSFLKNKYVSFIQTFIYFFVAWSLIQLSNPNSSSILFTVLGLKNYLFYVPLLWILPQVFLSENELKNSINYFLLLLLPIGSLAIIQFFSPPDSIFNVYAPSAVNLGIVLSGNNQNVRVTGTFSYIAGYTVYLGFCLALILPLLTEKQSLKWIALKLSGLFLIIITLFMTGARGLVFSSVIVIFGYTIFQGSKVFNFMLTILIRLSLPIVVLYVIINKYFSEAVTAFWLRVTLNQDIGNRVYGLFWEPFQFINIAGFLGYGPGSAFQGTLALEKILGINPVSIPVYYEAEPGRVTLEIGFIGFLIWYSFRILILIVNWQIFANLKTVFLRRLALSILMVQCINLVGQIVFNHTANLFYWFLNGLVLALPYLEQQKVNYGFFYLNRSPNP